GVQVDVMADGQQQLRPDERIVELRIDAAADADQVRPRLGCRSEADEDAQRQWNQKPLQSSHAAHLLTASYAASSARVNIAGRAAVRPATVTVHTDTPRRHRKTGFPEAPVPVRNHYEWG